MGFDAFGLPAENYAIKTGIHPEESTLKNIATMEAQLKRIGAMYDWDYEIKTCLPDYYKWTQWMFCNSTSTVLPIARKHPSTGALPATPSLPTNRLKAACAKDAARK